MERKEEIKQAIDSMNLWQSGAAMFQLGVEWADEHPKEGLWDSVKVCEWIKEHAKEYIWQGNYFSEEAIRALKTAMEE